MTENSRYAVTIPFQALGENIEFLKENGKTDANGEGKTGTVKPGIDPSKLLVINGENDAHFNGPNEDAVGGDQALESVTGRECPVPSWDCRGPEGDGYVLVKKTQTSTNRATHGYMDLPGVGAFLEPNWSSPLTTDAWGLYSMARWLKARTQP